MAKLSEMHEKKTRSRTAVKQAILKALRKKFPEETVDVSDGYQGNIHVLVVSKSFDSLSEKAKCALLWKIIDSTDLTAAERELVSLVHPVSVAELK